MDFRLIYEGDLKASGNAKTKVPNKNRIRRKLHDQLVEVWNHHPTLSWMKNQQTHWPDKSNRAIGQMVYSSLKRPMPEEGETPAEALGRKYERGGILFVPLVSEVFNLVCSLNILFLRRGRPGTLFDQSGDIDGRIKTLLDALRIPTDSNEMRGSPDATSPLFCLLEDDKLVTELTVVTDRLLKPWDGEGKDWREEQDVHLVIHVKVKSSVDNLEGLK